MLLVGDEQGARLLVLAQVVITVRETEPALLQMQAVRRAVPRVRADERREAGPHPVGLQRGDRARKPGGFGDALDEVELAGGRAEPGGVRRRLVHPARVEVADELPLRARGRARAGGLLDDGAEHLAIRVADLVPDAPGDLVRRDLSAAEPRAVREGEEVFTRRSRAIDVFDMDARAGEGVRVLDSS
ncbi:MAG: hypothetical protein AUG02_04820 [Chloroflexi bacterium 13_1_20CM_2_70_9]|nr:MAG: hypothetical protein AUG02_04820 [Chloroflexi bacterium 13_1_20CM_2_70_9]